MRLPPLLVRLLTGYARGWAKYADYGSPTGWADYLSFFLVNLLIGLSLRGLEFLSGDGFFALIGLLYGLVAIVPGLAITVRLIRGMLLQR